MNTFSSSSSSKKHLKSGKPGFSSASRSATSVTRSDPEQHSEPSTEDKNDDNWSAWEWDDKWQGYWRSREMKDGEWEYDYAYQDDKTPRNISSYQSTQDAPSIDGEVLGQVGFTTVPLIKSSSQRPTLPHISERDSSAADLTLSYSPNLASARKPSLAGNLDNDQSSPDFQEHMSSTYGDPTPFFGDDTTPQRGALEDDDDDDDDATEMNTQKHANLWKSQANPLPQMTGDRGIPIRVGNWQQDGQRTETTYSVSPSTMAHPYSGAYAPQANYQSNAYAQPLLGSADEPSTAISPAAQQAPNLDSSRILGKETVDEDSISLLKEVSLYGNFKVHHAKHFEFGKIFKILWTEPKGQGPPPQRTELVPTIYGEQFYTSIRRFVIFNQMGGHCLCLPILTYNRRGTGKSGAKPQDHAIIYTEKKDEKGLKPTELSGEPKLLKHPIRMDPKTVRDQLDSASRLNYAKIYTVEYNVKVCFIGKIHKDSIRHFKKDYDQSHVPLLEQEYAGFPDDDQGVQQAEKRVPEPRSQFEERDTAPPGNQRRDQTTNEQKSQGQRDHGKKKKKK